VSSLLLAIGAEIRHFGDIEHQEVTMSNHNSSRFDFETVWAKMREVFQALHRTNYSAPWDSASICEGK
jgi:hypothetical protein